MSLSVAESLNWENVSEMCERAVRVTTSSHAQSEPMSLNEMTGHVNALRRVAWKPFQFHGESEWVELATGKCWQHGRRVCEQYAKNDAHSREFVS